MITIGRAFIVAILVLGISASSSETPSNVKEVRIPAGGTVDLWLGINVTGKVYYAIRTKDGTNTIHMWWILEPTGRVKQLGKRSNDGSLDVPGLTKASVSAKLRGSATVDTVVYVGENVSVDHSLTFHW
jgi:hypothetical protein